MPEQCALFVEKHPQLAGFSAYYERKIRPLLKAQDGKRIRALIILFIAWPLILLAGYGFYYWMRYITPLETDKSVIFAFVVTGAVLTFVTLMTLEKVKHFTKDLLVSEVCGFFGWRFDRIVRHINFLDEFVEFGLVPAAHSDVFFSDRIIGKVKDVPFNALEVHMVDELALAKGKRKVNTFRGTLFRIEFPQKVFGQTVVLRDKGVFNPKKKGKMKRVGLVDPVFNKAFQAYGTDQVEARYILTPSFMQHLVDLETAVAGQQIRFGFMRNQLLIAVETRNRFEAGSMLKPLENTERAQTILNEIGAVHDVVDGVLNPGGAKAAK